MEWWHWILIGYGVIGFGVAIPMIVMGLRTGRKIPGAPQPRLGAVFAGALVFALFWPLILLPLLIIARKLKSAEGGMDLRTLMQMPADSAMQQSRGRVVDVDVVNTPSSDSPKE